jgi:hypothetical protein
MIWKDPGLIADIRIARWARCEFCRRPSHPHFPLQVAHILSKGAGCVEIPENIVMLHPECHAAQHAGNEPTPDQLLAIAAAREMTFQDRIRDMVYAIRRYDGKHLSQAEKRKVVERIRRECR